MAQKADAFKDYGKAAKVKIVLSTLYQCCHEYLNYLNIRIVEPK